MLIYLKVVNEQIIHMIIRLLVITMIIYMLKQTALFMINLHMYCEINYFSKYLKLSSNIFNNKPCTCLCLKYNLFI